MTFVPVTDAFDESEKMNSVEVEMTPAQIEWLEQMAEERGVSVGYLLRTIVTAKMRTAGADEREPSAVHSGDGAAPSALEGETEDAPTQSDEDNLLDRLRAVNEQLRDREQEQEKSEQATDATSLFPAISELPDPSDTTTQHQSNPAPPREGERSMFDMVEE